LFVRIKAMFLLLVLGLSCLTAAPGSSTSKLRKVKVYFYHDPGEYIDLSPVMRNVSANAPARGAINALLAGPTRQEERRGFGALSGASEFAIGSLKIVDGTAHINFVSSRTWHGWPGDLGPVRFKTAVELTLKQFAEVRNVIVSLNGDPKFADES
jgi:Sporulation and spore germination